MNTNALKILLFKNLPTGMVMIYLTPAGTELIRKYSEGRLRKYSE